MQGNQSVIHRKAQVAREEFDARGMSTSKALRLGLARVADEYYDLPLVVNTVEQNRITQTDLQANVGGDGLLVVLDGPEHLRGGLSLDAQFLTAMIEVQTTGKVREGRADPRPVTPTDAAICAPFIDRLFEAVQRQLADKARTEITGRFRFGDGVEDARALNLALDAPEYDVLRLSVDLAEGAKNGVLTVILPIVPDLATDQTEKSTKSRGRGSTDLGEVIRNAPVTLNAVLARLEMPLKHACKLEVGMRFPISPSALKDTQLTATGGHVVAHVVLGQVNGFRAARLVAGRNGPLPNEPDAADSRSDELGQSPDIDTGAAKGEGLASPTLANHMLHEPSDQSVDTEAELTQSR